MVASFSPENTFSAMILLQASIMLIGRRGVGGAERPKLVARLGERRRRPQRGGEQGKYQDCAAHQVPVNGGREWRIPLCCPPRSGGSSRELIHAGAQTIGEGCTPWLLLS